MDDGSLKIRSFRVVFRLERRIHRIDRYRVPLPYGLPLKSVGYAAAALLVVLLLQRLPLTGSFLESLAPPVRLVLLPVGASYALTQLRVDGRTAHATVAAWLRFVLGPKRYSAFRPLNPQNDVRCGDVATVSTGTDGHWHRGTVHGPADVLIGVPTHARRRGRKVILRRDEETNLDPNLFSLEAGEELVLR